MCGERVVGDHASTDTGILTTLERHPLGPDDGLIAAVARGSYLIVDVERPATRVYLVLLLRRDPAERLSLAHTRIAQGHLFLGPMSNLVSNRRRVLARICEDDVRAHDILSSSSAAVSLPSGLVETLERNGIPEWSLPDGVDFFSPVEVQSDGSLVTSTSRARAGDRLALLMAEDVLCVVVVRGGALTLTVRTRMVPYGADRHA